MRVTLHAAVLLHLADPALRAERSLFDAYLLLHVTAFHANGAWPGNMQIPWSGAFDVVRALPQEMRGRILQLLPGVLEDDRAAVEAARMVQAERAHQSSRTRALSA